MITQDEAKQLVDERLYDSPHGVMCSFIPINDKWALKVYDCPFDRDIHYKRQLAAAAIGLGPDVAGILDIDDISYAYITEIVEPYVPWHINTDEYRKERIRIRLEVKERFETEHGKELQALCDKLYAEIGFSFQDRHAGNVGFKDGRLICIDFGD